MSFKKSDIEFHGGHPAINVKSYGIDYNMTQKAMDKFNCTEKVAEKAIEFAWESAVERFWEDTDGTADYFLGKFGKVKTWQEGRSGGWLVVYGLPDVESWDAMLVSAWGRFEKALQSEIKGYESWENISEDIEANRWAEEYSQRYNFIDTPHGIKCVADANRVAAEARKSFLES